MFFQENFIQKKWQISRVGEPNQIRCFSQVLLKSLGPLTRNLAHAKHPTVLPHNKLHFIFQLNFLELFYKVKSLDDWRGSPRKKICSNFNDTSGKGSDITKGCSRNVQEWICESSNETCNSSKSSNQRSDDSSNLDYENG